VRSVNESPKQGQTIQRLCGATPRSRPTIVFNLRSGLEL
jgi:hypothetical protein